MKTEVKNIENDISDGKISIISAKEDLFDELSDFEYLDLRFGNKIFYK